MNPGWQGVNEGECWLFWENKQKGLWNVHCRVKPCPASKTGVDFIIAQFI